MRLILRLLGDSVLRHQCLSLTLGLLDDTVSLLLCALDNLHALARNHARLTDLLRDIQAHLLNDLHDIARIDERLAGEGEVRTALNHLFQLVEQLLNTDLWHFQPSLCKRRAVIS